MTLENAVNDYVQYIRYERGLSKTTVEGYISWLRNYQGWLRENGYPNPLLEAFTAPVLRRFFYAQAERGIRPRTLRSIFHPLRGLGDFLVKTEVLPKNPARDVTLPKKDAAVRKLVSDEEVIQLLAGCDRLPTIRETALTRALMSVFIYGGLRRQELLDLKLSDIRLTEKRIIVRSGKGSKFRTIFPCDECLEALTEWLAVREDDCDHDWVFARNRAHRVSYDGLKISLDRLKAVSGLRDHANIQPHSLRHNCATRLMRNGADIRSIQAFLGHSDLVTTSIYLHTDEEQQRSISQLGSLRSTSSVPPVAVTHAVSQKAPVRRLTVKARR